MNFSLPISPQLSLRLLEARHAEELFEVIDRNRAHIGAWLPWVGKIRSVEDERQWLLRVANEFAAGRMVTCSILQDGRIVGAIGTLAINSIEKSTDIGYWLTEESQGQGTMTLACRTFINYLFAEVGLHRITIRAAPENVRSCAVIERMGLRFEGTLKQAGATPNGWVDLRLYAILQSEWGATEVPTAP